MDLRRVLATCRQEMASEEEAQAEFWAVVRKHAARDLLCYGLYVHGRDSRLARQAAMSVHLRVINETLHRSGKAVIVTPPEHYKGLALDTPVPTPAGWTTMGDIAVGDEVFSADGSVTRVKAVSDVHSKPCLEITLSDGSTVACDEDHRWLTRTRKPQHGVSIKTAREIAETQTAQGRPNHGIPVMGGMELPEAILPIDPYVLGAWLGDGTSESGRITNADPEVWDAIVAAGHRLGPPIVKGPAQTRTIYGLSVLLGQLGLIHNKRIPTRYLRASEAQREALLMGLMDTDGHCSIKGQCIFTNTNGPLARDVEELVRSLGFKVRHFEYAATLNGRNYGAQHMLSLYPRVPVFGIQRKARRQKLEMPNDRYLWQIIESVQPVPTVPTRCIAVEHPSELYVAGRQMFVTHNSTLMRWHIEQWIGQETESHFADPDHPVPRAILAMNAAKQAWRQVKAIAVTLEGLPRYRELFPNVRPDKPWGWSSEELYVKRIRPLPEPTLFGCGVRGAIQGMHAGLGVVDDPTDQEDARSPKVLEEQIEWRLGVYADRLLEGALQRDIMTRWTDSDIFETRSADRECEALVMPACEDMGRPGYWSQHPEWGFAPGHDVLWPEAWSYERLMAKKREKLLKGDGGLWVMTYLCDPRRAEGRMFKRAWMRYGLPLEGPPPVKEEEVAV